MFTPPQTAITHSPQDRIQAIKHHPEFQRCLAVWRGILSKEAEGIALTDEEEAMKWAPRSRFSVEAELEATRYGLLSLHERERSTMTDEELAWRDCAPQLDYAHKAALIHAPLAWSIELIVQTVGQIVRVYKERLGIQGTRSHMATWQDKAAQLDQVNHIAVLRIPLGQPVESIEDVVRDIARNYKHTLGLASPQRPRRPEVDPWLVYQLHREEKLSLLAVTHRVFGTSGLPAYNEEVDALYARVKRAFRFAEDAIASLNQDPARKDS